MYPDRYRLGAFSVSRDYLVELMLQHCDFKEKYPDADGVAVAYDFDADAFVFKFRHPSMPVKEDGELIPRVTANILWHR